MVISASAQSVSLMFIKVVSAVRCDQGDVCGITSEELRLFIAPGAGADHGYFLISDFVTITDGAVPQQATLDRSFMDVLLKLGSAVRYSCRQQDCTTANDTCGDFATKPSSFRAMLRTSPWRTVAPCRTACSRIRLISSRPEMPSGKPA